ncbi:MAG TPA: sigma-70 family RNA polymerase sigma factor [Planctomycetota bacterium]|nr:sigma-70 family RNA polymerase sigma factor [Planctomycetota bacterium]
MKTAFRPEDWPRQVEALRRVARALVQDEDEREEALQKACLAALERGPGPPSLAWLRRVLRSRAFDAMRRRGLRSEQAFERRIEGVTPSAADIAQRLELHRAVVEAVSALREPYRQVVWLRYFEGLGPSAIALELGLPVKTVKTRLGRALRELRGRLERRFGSGSEGWRAVVVAAFVRPAKSAAGASATVAAAGGIGIMVKKIVALAALVAAVWGVAHFAPLSRRAAKPEPVAEPSRASNAELQGVARNTELASIGGDERAAAAAPREKDAPAAEPIPETGSLVVHVVWHDGEPAPDVGIDFRLSHVGGPNTGVARAVSDSLGIAHADGLPSGELLLKSDRGGTQKAEVVAGSEREVRFALAKGVDVEGRVVDGTGRAVPGAEIWLTNGYSDWQGGRVVARADAGGAFRLRSVPPRQSLGAIAQDRAPSELVDLELLDTEWSPVRVELVLHHEGGGLAGRVLGPNGAGVPDAWVSVGATNRFNSMRAGGGFMETWSPRTARTDAGGHFAIAGLPLGELAVQARASGFPIWKGKALVQARETAQLSIELRPGAVIEGTVRDADGTPCSGAIVRAFDEPLDESFIQGGQFDHEGAFGYPSASADETGHYRLAELPAGTLHLYAHRSKVRRRQDAPLVPFVRDHEVLHASDGERLVWDPVLDPGHTLRGVVVHRDGLPMGGVFVSARNAHSGARQSMVTDPEGRFAFVNMELAPYALEVQLWSPPPGTAPLQAEDVWPDQGEIRLVASFDKPIEQTSGVVLGRIDDAGRRLANPGALSVILETRGNSWRVNPEIDSERFRFEGVEPGDYKVVAFSGEDVIHAGEWFTLAAGEERDLGTLVTELGATAVLSLERAKGTEAAEPVAYLRPADTNQGRRVEFGLDSERRIENLSAGSYAVRLYGKGIAAAQGTLVVPAGGEAKASLRVEPAVERPFEIELRKEPPPGRLRVRIQDRSGRSYFDLTEISARVAYPYKRRAWLPLGHFVLSAETDTGSSASVEFDVLTLDPDQPAVRLVFP